LQGGVSARQDPYKAEVKQLKFNQLHVKTDRPGLSYWTPQHTIQHLFVIPTADYAAKLLLRMGKERPKHVELLSF
jgi:hypothetical protein